MIPPLASLVRVGSIMLLVTMIIMGLMNVGFCDYLTPQHNSNIKPPGHDSDGGGPGGHGGDAYPGNHRLPAYLFF